MFIPFWFTHFHNIMCVRICIPYLWMLDRIKMAIWLDWLTGSKSTKFWNNSTLSPHTEVGLLCFCLYTLVDYFSPFQSIKPKPGKGWIPHIGHLLDYSLATAPPINCWGYMTTNVKICPNSAVCSDAFGTIIHRVGCHGCCVSCRNTQAVMTATVTVVQHAGHVPLIEPCHTVPKHMHVSHDDIPAVCKDQ